MFSFTVKCLIAFSKSSIGISSPIFRKKWRHVHQLLSIIKEQSSAGFCSKISNASSCALTAEFKGKLHHYPCYKTEDIADEAIQAIVLHYNMMIDDISKDKLEKNKLENSFKCASVLLFGFLTLHPFADGNGRLARLLCSHCLNMFSPFPTAIYNMFSPSTRDDYITAIVNARKNLELSSDKSLHDAIKEAMLILEQKPADLCSLIIESNWFTWRHFLRKIGEDIPMLDLEKAD